MRSIHHLSNVLALLVLQSVCSAQGAVLVVDSASGPGTAFTNLSDAVSAAAAGDVLLVRTGNYPDAIELDGESLVVVAEVGASVQAESAIVHDLGPGGAVLVRGLTLSNALTFSGKLDRNVGSVWFEDSTLVGVPPVTSLDVSGGLRVDECSALALARCTLTRIFADSPLGTLHVSGASRVHVRGTTIEGPPAVGAIESTDSFLELFGSSALGADGAAGIGFPFCTAEDGGDGLVLHGTSEAVLLDATLAGGTGGAPCGANGEALVQAGGSTVMTLPPPYHAYRVDTPVRDDELVHASIEGEPGDRVWILYSTLPGPGIASLRFDGELLLGAPRSALYVGLISPAGTLTLSGAAPTLAPGEQSAVFYTQAVVYSPSTARFRMGDISALVVLDDAF